MTKQELENLATLVAEKMVLAQKKVLTTDEASKFLGVSTSTLYKWTMKKVIPHYKPNGGMCYFNRHELENWMQRYRIDTPDEIEQKAQSYCNSKKGGVR